MKTLLEIVFTLKEAALRFAWQFWYLAVIAVALEGPLYLILLSGSHGQAPHKQPMDTARALLSFLAIGLGFFLPAAGTCATFGLFGGPMEFSPWERMVAMIRNHWWTVTKVYIAVGFLEFVPLLAYVFTRHAPLVVKSVLDLFIAAYFNVVGARFAIAAPLAVAEDTKEGEAMKRSWKATRAPFWYVLGCTVFGHEAVNEIYTLFTRVVDLRSTPAPVVFAWLGVIGFVATFAIVVQWLVYIRLRNDEAASAVQTSPRLSLLE